MQISDFKSIVMTFADPGTDLLFDRSQLIISVNGDLIEANITTKSGDVYVDEGSGEVPASKWILTRLARLPLLATRLKESVPPTEYFVSPAASLLPTLEKGPLENPIKTDDALQTTIEAIDDHSPLEAMVLYITSDAGEGKTSLINELARTQAKRFTDNESDWLLVPIPLGGRHFLRFDDITVGALQNRYRFPFLYYNSFLALVRMGVIVPAFDGFEEMFVEGSSGEALSAMGILVEALKSQGSMIVAARKAYFDFENLRTQEKLFDTIRTLSVGFGKIELQRWSENQFLAYCRNRSVANAKQIYNCVSERLTASHPLLTRAVLVKRLVDVASTSKSLESLLNQLHESGEDFFSLFVRSLIEREANEKWIDRSGEKEVGTPLLTVDEHCEMLSQIALSMWESRVGYIKRDGLEFVSDYFTEATKKNTFQAQQIRERIRGHAMLVPSTNAVKALEFDHDEFRMFFLGEGIAKEIAPLNERAKAGILGIFRRGVLPRQAQHALIRAVSRNSQIDLIKVVQFLLDVSSMESQTSYVHENCSDIIIRMLSGLDANDIEIKDLAFGLDALRDRKLSSLQFKDCYFAPSSLEQTQLEDCHFTHSRFTQLRVFDSTKVENTTFEDCTVDALSLVDKDREIWDPEEVRSYLQQLGVTLKEADVIVPVHAPSETTVDDDVRCIEKLVRFFMRSTHITENVMLMKLGTRGRPFIDDTLPILLREGILEETQYAGSGDQRRFRLGVPLENVNAAIAACRGSFNSFLEQF